MKGSLPMSKTLSSTKPNSAKKVESSDKLGFDINDIKSLMALLNESEINEIEVTEGERSIRLRKDPTPIISAATAMPANVVANQAQQPTMAPVTPLPEKKIDGKTIKAPMVGTFYISPSPDSAPFVGVGDKVKKGQTLCIIEAMKTMNQIEAEESGTIVEVLIDNAHPVEYGEALFIIK